MYVCIDRNIYAYVYKQKYLYTNAYAYIHTDNYTCGYTIIYEFSMRIGIW
jgi:hypothetical protein